MAELNFIITADEKHLKAIERIDRYFTSILLPDNLNGSDSNNVLIRRRKDFEGVCVALKTQGIADPKKLTIFEFFSTLDHFEAKRKPK